VRALALACGGRLRTRAEVGRVRLAAPAVNVGGLAFAWDHIAI